MSTTAFILLLVLLNTPIIIRHDKSDSEYQALATQFQNTLCHLNIHIKPGVPEGEGTVIHKNWILTAAHCAFDIDNKLKKGETHEVIITNKYYKVDKVIIHENWENNEAYDIALIRIETAALDADPVQLYSSDQELNKMVYVVGRGDYGNGEIGVKGNDQKLRAATNRVDEATDFWLKWTFDNPEESPNKVTELEGISGPGDSGGPAFIKENNKFFLVGISSGQSTRNTNGKEGVYGVIEYYTRVSKYAGWIRKNMD